MSALLKSSILLLPATAITAYLCVVLYDGGFDLERPQPQGAICMQDGERLARLRANPSLDEGLRFVGEIRCLQLWPQLQTVLDGLSNPSRLTVVSNPNGAEYYARTGGDVTPATAAPGPTSAAVDDACKHDEDRLAELRAKPSIDAAIRFDSKLRCPGLKPQLPAILDSLHNAAGSVDAASRNAPALNTPSAGETAPPVTDSLATEVASPSLTTPASATRNGLQNFRPSPPSTKRCVS